MPHSPLFYNKSQFFSRYHLGTCQMNVLKSVWTLSIQPIGSPWTGKGGKWVGEFSVSKIGSKDVSQSQKGPMCLSSRWQFEGELELLTTELCWEQVYSVMWSHCYLALDLMPAHTLLMSLAWTSWAGKWHLWAPPSMQLGKRVVLYSVVALKKILRHRRTIIISSCSKC